MLPATVELKLPRIPVGGGNGIDDCRQERGGRSSRPSGGGSKMARSKFHEERGEDHRSGIALGTLPAIALNADWKRRFREGIVGFARELKPMALGELAAKNKKHLGINVAWFRRR